MKYDNNNPNSDGIGEQTTVCVERTVSTGCVLHGAVLTCLPVAWPKSVNGTKRGIH